MCAHVYEVCVLKEVKDGDNGGPCGIPTLMFCLSDVKSDSLRIVVRSWRKLLIHRSIGPLVHCLRRLCSNRAWESFLNAPVTSRRSNVVITFLPHAA